MHSYVYAIATNVGIMFVTSILGLGGFILLQGVSPQAAIMTNGIPALIGVVSSIYLVVVLPIVVLPEILPVSRLRVIVATLVGGVLWALGNYAISQLLLMRLGILWT
jgi:hypothetical protein